ncbi:hypothetical protein DFH06DRAFT_1362005 [Mycena polygramma]|nr:hypothetical protein DFH06DRAFT_1362005 [Mycena polygramma]
MLELLHILAESLLEQKTLSRGSVICVVDNRQTTDAKGGQDRIRQPSRTFAQGRSRTGKLGISHLANTTGRLRVCDCLAFGCEKNGREEKGVMNDPDRSWSRGRAKYRRRPEVSWADGEVARADRSTEGQRPEVVWTEVGGQTGGEPEHSEVSGAANSANSAGSIGIGGGNAGDVCSLGILPVKFLFAAVALRKPPIPPRHCEVLQWKSSGHWKFNHLKLLKQNVPMPR